jgi:pimeloyl-ACP methyl ester carboxylesterase
MRDCFLPALVAGVIGCAAVAPQAWADDGARLLSVDHYVHAKSTAPAIMGQDAQIYVREKVLASTLARGAAPANRIALFVHGAGTPAEVAFDVPYKDYSWMAYLARAGFDVFAMDMTGYGRSTRPAAMNDPCNFPKDQQAQFVGNVLKAACTPSYDHPITTMSSDWNDVGAVVDYLRGMRHVDRLALIGWSQGGPRSAGYTARNPEKISRLVILAPAYNRDMAPDAPDVLPRSDGPMNAQSEADFAANWDRQAGCPEQYEPAASRAVWSGMIASDPVGATWGTGVRRAPTVPSWGFNKAVAGRIEVPFLMISGQHDKQVAPQRVRDLFADLSAKQKVFIDLACSSHNAMWEKNHLLLFQASLEWLKDGTVQGKSAGEIKLGYSGGAP